MVKKGEKYIILINLSKISEFQIAKKIYEEKEDPYK